jgi:translation initiation factor 2B subunit (eIF-2B alpha/beta/delta family)
MAMRDKGGMAGYSAAVPKKKKIRITRNQIKRNYDKIKSRLSPRWNVQHRASNSSITGNKIYRWFQKRIKHEKSSRAQSHDERKAIKRPKQKYEQEISLINS